MVHRASELAAPMQQAPAAAGESYKGKVVYLYAFDIAYEIAKTPVAKLCGQPVVEFAVDASKRSPRHVFFYRPRMVRLPPIEMTGPHGPVRIERAVKLLRIGAISITISVPFEVRDIPELVAFHDLAVGSRSLHDEVLALADLIRRELAPSLIRATERLAEEEAYTVFCIESRGDQAGQGTSDAEAWLRAHRREVAALLTQEATTDQLSEQEATESTGKTLSYYDHDLLVTDWDAALLVDEPANFDETLYVLELANLQLAELEAYDRILDNALERAYADLRGRSMRSRRHILRDLREIRIDLARFSDELSNITKFFGDWHLARVYQGVAARFHLSDWNRSIDTKLKTLDDLYQFLNQDRLNAWMLLLEATIVLLFIIDLAILLLGLRY